MPSEINVSGGGPSGRGRAVELVHELYDFFNAGNLDDFTARLAPDVVWLEPHPAPGGRFEGSEEVRLQVLKRSLDTFRDLRMTPRKTVVSGDRIIVTGTFAGRHRQTDEAYRLPFFHVWHVRDEKVVAFRHTNDPKLQAKALEGERITF